LYISINVMGILS